MPSALPARKVAGTKTAAVRRKSPAQPKPPPDDYYTDALRERCMKNSLIRKPPDVKECPRCHGEHKVICRQMFNKKHASKWFYKCTNTIVNIHGQRVRCQYFHIPEQPPVPAPQLAAIEAQRKADYADLAAGQAQREADRANGLAAIHPDDAELQLAAVEATRALSKAREVAEDAREALRQGDRVGWEKNRNKTPPPHPSSSRITLDLAVQGSASSSRTSTSQSQLDRDREVALVVQRNWDAETDTSPESIHTAKFTDNEHLRDSRARSGHAAVPAIPADSTNSNPANRMRHAARLQQQAADWLGESTRSGVENSKERVSSSSLPIDTPTPAARVRNVRPFPVDLESTGDKPSVGQTKRRDDAAILPLILTTEGNFKMNLTSTAPHRDTLTPPPSTQPRRTDDRSVRTPRMASTTAGSPPPSTQPRRTVKPQHKAEQQVADPALPQHKRPRSPSVDSVISISSDDTPPPRKRQHAEDNTRVKQEAEEEVLNVGAKLDGVTQMQRRESAPLSTGKRRPLPKPVRASKSSTRLPGSQPAAEPVISPDLPPSDPPAPNVEDVAKDRYVRRAPAASRESTLESSNKENHDVRPSVHPHGPCIACPPSDPSSPSVHDYKDHTGTATGRAARDTYDSPTCYASRRAPRSLPHDESSSRGGLAENTGSKAPWDSSEDDEPAHAPPRRREGGSHPAAHKDPQDGHTSDRDGDVEDVSDDNETGGYRDTDALESAIELRSDLGGNDVGTHESTDSSAELDYLDYLADEAPSRLVEHSVDAALRKPWTHELDDVEAWYCTVFIWIVNEARPREVLLSMHTGETEVQLSDRPSIYTALGGLRVRTWLVWDFASSIWIEQDFSATVSVSEFDQHTILIKLRDVTRCVEFGRAMAHAQEPLWPALNNIEDDAPREDEDDNGNIAKPEHDDQAATVVAALKPSRKGKEVVRT